MNFTADDRPTANLLSKSEKGLFWAQWLEMGVVAFSILLVLLVFISERKFVRHEKLDTLMNAKSVLGGLVRECELLTLGARSALQNMERIDGKSWSNYVAPLGLHPEGPFNMGFAPFVSHEEIVRRPLPGLRLSDVSPPGQRSHYAPLLYFTPFFNPSPPLKGFDGWAHPDRRRAMETARDTGGLAVTPPLQLRGGVNGQASPGVVFYAAVYTPGPIPAGVSDRRASLRGFVALALDMKRAHDLLESGEGQNAYVLQDPEADSFRQWLFGDPTLPPSANNLSTTVVAGDRRWKLSLVNFDTGSSRALYPAFWLFLSGLGISAIGGVLLHGNKKAHADALYLAKSLTLKLRESVLFLDSILRELPVIVYVKDTEKLRFVHVNPAGEKLLGISRWELIGRRNHECFLPEEADVFEAHDRAVVDSGRATETPQETVTTRTRKKRLIRVRRVPIKDAQGGFRYLLCVVEDITERASFEATLRQAKSDAESSNRAKSVFLAQMSHELRTPLNSVIGFANLLLKNKKSHLDEEELQRVQKILGNGTHLLELINSILDLSRVEAGRMPVNKSSVPLGPLVSETVGQLAGSLPETGPVTLRAELPKSISPLETDSSKLKQILINLLGNAMKFTPRGSITVRVKADDKGVPLCLEVSDTGIGIPADKVGRIFEAFQQLDDGTSRQFGGTGLGLTVSRALVNLLGYRLELESAVGRGSTFRVVFRG